MGFIEPVYTIQLERQANNIANNYIINVKGLQGATIGYGPTPANVIEKVDVKIYNFYNNWDAIAKSLNNLPKHNSLVLGNGTIKYNKRLSSFFLFQGVSS